MAKPAKKSEETAAPPVSEILKEPAEIKYAHELEALRQNEKDEVPAAWKLSPRSVLAYIVGTKKPLLEALPVSARTGQGLEEVRRRILRMLDIGRLPEEGAAVVFTPRQERLLKDLSAGRLPLEEAKAALLR